MRPVLPALLAIATTAVAAPPAMVTAERLDRSIEVALASSPRKLGPPQSPELLLRRMSLDLTGLPPRVSEVHAVRVDASGRVLDDWLARTEAGAAPRQLLATRLSSLVLGRRSRLDYPRFEQWLAGELARDPQVLPLWSRIVTASGTHPDEAETAWIVRFGGDAAELTTQFSRTMLGESIGCARCHDHPFARWKRVDFLALAASFAQVGYAEQPNMGSGERFKIWERGWGESYLEGHPPRVIPPAFPTPGPVAGVRSTPSALPVISASTRGGMAVSDVSTAAAGEAVEPAGPPRRAALGAWLADPANPMPARALANRTWGWLMGRPLVTPPSDLASGALHLAGVLDELADHLLATNGDVLGLARIIMRTRAYRARRDEGGPFPPRRLSLEELATALEQLAERPGLEPRRVEAEAPRRDRLMELLIRSGAGDLAEGHEVATVARGLFLAGGGPLSDLTGRMELSRQRLEAEHGDAGVAEWLFEVTLSRAPRPAERAWLAARLETDPDKQRALGDALWALVNSAEFGVIR